MKKFFEGLSLSSIVAGTLAAVTSFLLASKIGIAGSVIGAAASYIVSAVATKIYQNILTASGEKLQSPRLPAMTMTLRIISPIRQPNPSPIRR